MKRDIIGLSLALLLSGCTLKTFELNKDIAFSESYLHVKAQEQIISEQWWKEFGSETLSVVVEESLKNNHDMLSAYEKLTQARLQLGIAKSDLYPSASLSGSSSAKRTSSNVEEGDWKSSRSSSISMGISYELDVWKKIEASTKASEASFKASQYDWDALHLSLAASMTSNYLQYIALEERIKIAYQNLESAKKLLEIVEAKYKEGSVSEVDVSRQKTTLLSQEASLLSLKQTQQELFHAMAVLSGKKPEAFALKKESFETITLPNVDAGMPSALLLHRPDIASIRAQIEAQESTIYATYVKRFPSFSLSGSAGLVSNLLLGLSNPSGSLSSSVGASYALFDNGVADLELDIQKSKGKALLLSYEKTVFTALKEVENALYDVHVSAEKEIIQQKLLHESERSFELAKDKYTFGSSDFATLVDAQRTLYQVKDQMIQQRLSKILATVELYKVLGGGWQEK